MTGPDALVMSWNRVENFSGRFKSTRLFISPTFWSTFAEF